MIQVYVKEILASREGMEFWLYPVKEIHTLSNLADAIRQIRRDRDVVKIHEKWISQKSLEYKQYYKENAKGQDL